MNFDQIKQDPAYQAYMQQVTRQIGDLKPALQNDIRMEINSHIYESLASAAATSTLAEVLERLGDPAQYLPEWTAQKKLETATQSYDPVRIIKALFLAMRYHGAHMVKYVLFGLLYLFTFSFAFLALAKLIFPAHAGFFHYPNGQYGFGWFRALPPGGTRELLGAWFSPLCFFAALSLYMLITLLLKVSLVKRK